MYDDQNRPPWLRNLRAPRPETDLEPDISDTVVAEPLTEPDTIETPVEAEADVRSAITRQQLLLLAILLWGNVTILGCLCLMATGTVVP
jgi:hypothetical protein